ncbi:MAG TPA: hypothetical protein VK787_11710 [Puia sp.]|nr:hypothetical protein [Puia sp.]
MLISCSKSSSSGTGGPTGGGGGGGTTDTVPTNITDMRGGTSGITLNPYPGFPTVSQLIPLLATGYYYIQLEGMDTISFVIQADSNSGGNAGVVGETSEGGPNYFTSGDSLQFLETQIKAVGSLGDTELVYYTKDLAKGYTLTSTDTTNFSDAYSQTQIYYSGFPSNTGYNLYNIESYIAFRIKNSTGYRYGWILASSAPPSGNLFTVYEIAFDKNYNELIAIGEYK